MNNSSIEKSVIAFVLQKSDVDASLETMVFDDLQIDGIDALMFMNDFFSEFKVNSSGYHHERYARTESEITNIFKTLWDAIFNRKQFVKKSFPVSHLVEVIKKGQWFEYAKG